MKTVDSKAHAALAASDPAMAELIERLGHRSVEMRRRGAPKPDAFGALLRIVVAQQVSSAAARTIHARLLESFGGCPPTPVELLAAGEEHLRAAGLSSRKASYLRGLAEAVSDGGLDLDELVGLDDAMVVERVSAIRGFGRWSAEMFLIFHLERPDVFSSGDLGLRRAIQLIHGRLEPPPPDEAERIAERWRPHRTLAAIYLWEVAGGRETPRRSEPGGDTR